jgi:hypothetical protein
MTNLRKYADPRTCIYFCMENDTIWRQVFGFTPEDQGGLPAMLDRCGFTVHEDERGVLLDVSGSEPLNKVFQTLASHHLEYETADLVSCVYQG